MADVPDGRHRTDVRTAQPLQELRSGAGTYAIARYEKETHRLYRVLEDRLSDRPYVAQAGYSIADIALFPFVMRFDRLGIAGPAFPNVQRWVEQIAARQAVQRGLSLLMDRRRQGPPDAETRANFFGDAQYRR